MNEFFWDLLEPTFGEEIDYTWKDRSWELEAGWRVDLAPRGQLGLTAHWRDQRPAVDVRYLNSGSRAELRGLRRSDLRQALSSWRYALAYQRPLGPAWRLHGEWGYSRREMHLRAQQQDRPQSASGVLLDLVELGNGWGDGKGVDGKIRGSWQSPARLHIEAVLGWGRSTYQLRGEGSTPVLGFRLRTLPISHQADVDLVGEIATWVGGVVAHKTWRRLRLDVGALAARSELEVRTRADAQMEFGLIVQPLHTVSRYRIGLYRFFAVPAVQLSDHFLVEYQVAQYLVDITDRERPGAQAERDEETRGGFVQILTLKYKL